MNGLYDAKLDHAPVIAITGQVPTQYIGTGYHQEVDPEELIILPKITLEQAANFGLAKVKEFLS